MNNNTEANRRCAELMGWEEVITEDPNGFVLYQWMRREKTITSICAPAYDTDEYLGELLNWFTTHMYEVTLYLRPNQPAVFYYNEVGALSIAKIEAETAAIAVRDACIAAGVDDE